MFEFFMIPTDFNSVSLPLYGVRLSSLLYLLREPLLFRPGYWFLGVDIPICVKPSLFYSQFEFVSANFGSLAAVDCLFTAHTNDDDPKIRPAVSTKFSSITSPIEAKIRLDVLSVTYPE